MNTQRGFSLVELVVVLTLVGILSFAAVTRLPGRDGVNAQGFAEQVAATLRYAQRAAVAQRRPMYVNLDSAARRLQVCLDAASPCGTRLQAPSGGDLEVTGPAGLTLASANAQIAFDALGRPTPAAGAQVQVSGGGQSVTVAVEAETGYVRRS